MTINWGGWIFSAVVLLLLFFISMILKNPVRLSITGKRAKGIVVAMAKVEGSEPDTLRPIVEFVMSTGERASATSRELVGWSLSHLGDKVTVLYNPSNPSDAHLVMLNEYRGVGFILGFITIIILMWIAVIVGSGGSIFDDPFHLLPKLIDHFRLNPVRFPIIFILSLVIPSCGFGTYFLTKQAIDLRSNGIIAPGYVAGYHESKSKMNDGSEASGVFPMIKYSDATGTSHTIRRSLAKPMSRLKSGDVVEVIYPIRHPDKGVVNTWDEFWPVPIFFGFLTVAFLMCFVLVLKGVM